jgi:predicted glycoside hydrolase/deacetylase ChbG (UPF0249 family)
MSERYLIINADDFGICDSVDRAIVRLLEEKRLTSTCIMCTAPLAVKAISIASERRLPAGVHWTLNSDWDADRWHTVTPADMVPSINDAKGLLHDTKALAKQAKSREITTELEAQVKLMADGGCMPDHADSHCGTLYGTNGRMFFINAYRVCRKYNMPFRMPKRNGFLNDQFGGCTPRYIRAFHAVITSMASAMGVDLLDDLITNPWPVRKIPSYEALRDFYLSRIAVMGEGITEMFLHPSYPDPGKSAMTEEWTKREMEMKFLLSDDLFTLADKEGIKLVSWREAPFRHRRKETDSNI